MTIFKMKILIFIVILSTGCIVYWSSTQINSQSSNTVIVREINNEIELGSKINGSIMPLNYNGENLKQFILSQPLPELSLTLNQKDSNDKDFEFKVNLSEESKSVLYNHWLKTLNHHYMTEFNELSTNINYQKEDVILVQSTIDTEKVLLNTPITSDFKSRNFSPEEAKQLVILIRDKSRELIQKVREFKIQN